LPLRFALVRQLLADGYPVELPLSGISMRPLFSPGDRVRVQPATAADVHLGDVVLIGDGDWLMVHRLVRKNDRSIITRGDGLPDDDAPLPPSAIVGRVEVPPTPLAIYAALRALVRC
jgi:phage repressor protein C with HTH and peptisase S24 domain